MLSNRTVAAAVLVEALRKVMLCCACIAAPGFGLIALVLGWYSFGSAFRGEIDVALGAGVLSLLGFFAAAGVVLLHDYVRGLLPPPGGWRGEVPSRLREEASWPH